MLLFSAHLASYTGISKAWEEGMVNIPVDDTNQKKKK